ncbi:Transcriptional regulator, contains XRE-family HTH domain [Amycolatopsis sacchari]|uniref:Transcriptional regulator, contains XRE-family HTH domain n=2 Tax=Amycolatopsis sacchari TaxID=115433 RepID=A0A1I3U2B0_9PSEU|nr:Transcriptional regulator, contains XRE-family HTH domain [Amycolatopsis sacchari]
MQADGSWLSSRTVDLEINTGLLAEVLREYRKAKGLSQADLAQILNLDQSYVSKIENGQRQVRDLETLVRIAQQLNISPNELGVSSELLQPVSSPSTSILVGEVDTVEVNQAEWRRVRRHLNRNRGELAKLAADLYRPEARISDAPFIARREWMPSAPVPLEDIQLEWLDHPGPIAVTGTEPEACAMLPLRAPGRRFERYTSAIRYLDKPALFENRTSYRLLGVDLAADVPRMKFCLGTYFDKLDVSEAIAHELAAAQEDAKKGERPTWSDLPLRHLIGDPFDLERRAVMPAIETLTLRRSRETGKATFLLHWRDPAKVATAAGIYGLIPAGEFQPSTVAGWDKENDFDLWRNMVREYSEEMLGEPERDGTSGQPLDYDNWPLYRQLQQARDAGKVSAYCLGVGLDTLTLTATILTVTVIDDDVFDALFGESVQVNAEGVLVTAADSTSVSEGVPFDEECVTRLLTKEPMASPGACILARSWRFREQLLT